MALKTALLCNALIAAALLATEVTAQVPDDGVATPSRSADALYEAGRYSEALPLALQALNLVEAQPADVEKLAARLHRLAEVFRKLGRFSEAQPLYARALNLREQHYGPAHPELAVALDGLAWCFLDQGKVTEAEPLIVRGLAIREETLGDSHADVATSLNGLAAVRQKQQRFQEAEQLHLRALAIRERALGTEHRDVALTLANLAGVYVAMSKTNEAERYYLRAITVYDTALGPDHVETAYPLYGLLQLYEWRGQPDKALGLGQRFLEIQTRAHGPEHVMVAASHSALARLLADLGRYAESEARYRQALAISLKLEGPESVNVATTWNNLADLYLAQGRYAESQPMSERALAIYEKVLGPEDPAVAISLNNLSAVHIAMGNPGLAAPYAVRALAILEKQVGPRNPQLGIPMHNLARTYADAGQLSEAEPLFQRALALSEEALGPEHPIVVDQLNGIGVTYVRHRRYELAEPPLLRVVAIRERILGADHPDVATGLHNLAGLYGLQNQNDRALPLIRRATAIRRLRTVERIDAANDDRAVQAAQSELRTARVGFVAHVRYLARMAQEPEAARASLQAEALEVAQLARVSGTGSAIAQMAARFARGNDALAMLVRSRQDQVVRLRALDAELVTALTSTTQSVDSAAIESIRTRIQSAEAELATVDSQLSERFPEYRTLTSASPISVAQVQELLKSNEAMLSFLVADTESYLWVIRHDRLAFRQLPLTRKDLERRVAEIRLALDAGSELRPFSALAAYELFGIVLAPVMDELNGVDHVLVVPDGPLQSLPLAVLIAEPPAPTANYRDMPWLAKRFAFSTLPSELSLRALRRFAASRSAPEPFVGFGDPTFHGKPGSSRSATALYTARGTADIDQVNQLAPLPDSAREIKAMATALGAKTGSVYLREAASETLVKRLVLSRYRTVAFATHGVLAGDMRGVVEPALALSPPTKASEVDDGLLTASEIAQLKLNADWVVLSACNTASTDGQPGADGLSGLAKAFIYAGTRSLLVSHWPVESRATTLLTTRMMREASRTPGLSKAGALQRAMLSMLNDASLPMYAHPVFWAPFVLVGEGSMPVGKPPRASARP